SDGTKIPMSVVYRRNVKLDGSAPMLLYGYGSYGISIPPSFSAARLALLDRGVIFVIAHIRGGGELGEPWRDAGRMMNKINTFTDFIACGEHLIKNKYTSKDRLVIQGASAGGMLMGAVAKLRDYKTDHNPLLLKVNMGAGHGGASGRYDAYHETAFDYAFMLWQMGIMN